jgi:hypothetical protein
MEYTTNPRLVEVNKMAYDMVWAAIAAKCEEIAAKRRVA